MTEKELAHNKFPVSVCIVTYDEEENIRRCLESVAWADEIIVVDSLSDDRTIEICREFTDKVTQRTWKGQIDQKTFALSRAHHEWILLIDADERLSPGLIGEVKRELSEDNGDWDGFCFPRRVYYLGRWISHGEWYPEYKLRLFRKSKARIGGEEPHDRVELVEKGRVKYLKEDLWHFTYKDISDQVARLNNFSSISSKEMMKRGRMFHIVQILLRPPARFITGYILRGGFRDGIAGFIIAAISSFYVFLKYCKLWEMRKVSDEKISPIL
jgi:glycosyltransferase involved in cell wall biosynthesis